MNRLLLRWIVPVVLVLHVAAVASASPDRDTFVGTFSGGGITLELKRAGDALRGSLRVEGVSFPVSAKVRGERLDGRFQAEGETIRFSAKRNGDVLVVESGGATHRLSAAGRHPNNPLAKPSGTAVGSHKSFGGHYVGLTDATGALLTLEQQGNQIIGALSVDGVTYPLEGQVSAGKVRGTVFDPTGAGSQPFRIKHRGEKIAVTLPQITEGPQTFVFKRGGPGAHASAPRGYPAQGGYPTQGGYPAQGGYGGQAGVDPRLVGNWTRTESMVSGTASFASQENLVVRADGTYTLSSGGSAGGTADVSAWVGGGGGTSGRWRVRGDLVETSEGGPWQPYARYIVRGNDLMFTFSDGHKEIWERR